jgi:type IV secretion system protein VirD4
MSAHITPSGDDGKPRRPLASARFIQQDDLDRQGYRLGDFWLGRSLSGKPVGWNEEVNLLTCAGPGSGKGTSSVMSNLLQFPGSTVVVDPKGELATMTAAYRRDVLGHKVIVLDPTRTADVPEELRGTYNPFDELDIDDPNLISAAQTLAEGIIVPNPKSKEPFFDHSALDFVQSCILYMVKHYPDSAKNFMKLRETVAMGDKLLYEAFLEAQRQEVPDYEESPGECFEMFKKAMFSTPDFNGVIQETAANLASTGGDTLGSVLATARINMSFLKAPELASVLASTHDPDRTFRLNELRRQDRPLTVYLCLPVDMMPMQGRWFRMIILRMIQYIQRTGASFDKERHHPILMMIDEFFQLGPIPSLVNTLTYARGAGLRMWLIVQDLNQVKHNYPDSWETILGACGIKQFFGVNDLFTAKYIAEFIGEEEIDVPSVSITKTYSDTKSENNSTTAGTSTTDTTGTNWSETAGTTASDTVSEGTSTNNTYTTGTNKGEGFSQGQSQGQSQGESGGASNSTTHEYHGGFLGIGRGYGRDPRSASASSSAGWNTGWNTGSNTGHNTSTGSSESNSFASGRNASRSHSSGTSSSTTTGGSDSQAKGRSDSETTGWGKSIAEGVNYSLSMAKQKRQLLKPEDVLLQFTKDNLLQLTHIRDQGGLVLFRTPFYADPYFRRLVRSHENSK